MSDIRPEPLPPAPIETPDAPEKSDSPPPTGRVKGPERGITRPNSWGPPRVHPPYTPPAEQPPPPPPYTPEEG